MVKITKSNPYSKRNGVKNETMPYKIDIQLYIQHSLTAMGWNPGEKQGNIWNPERVQQTYR